MLRISQKRKCLSGALRSRSAVFVRKKSCQGDTSRPEFKKTLFHKKVLYPQKLGKLRFPGKRKEICQKSKRAGSSAETDAHRVCVFRFRALPSQCQLGIKFLVAQKNGRGLGFKNKSFFRKRLCISKNLEMLCISQTEQIRKENPDQSTILQF